MPELPEVETIARGLRRELVGRRFAGASVTWPRTVACPTANEFEAQIAGRRVDAVGRRGKYVVMTLDAGFLLIHLKMSGRLRLARPGETVDPADGVAAVRDKHTHVVFSLDDGRELHFHDTRKFGRIYLVDDPQVVTGRLGPEPLDEALTLDEFRERLARRSGRLKSLLLNQAFLAGTGNIYADEALFLARLHPLRTANSLDADEQERLYHAIRTVLARAIRRRGTTLDDSGYVDAEGQAGSYQEAIAVYGRGGEPCLVCGTTIERIVVGGRSAHYCPACQSAS
jgi:formamidopyrimidine-DNA glycosylase